MIVLLSRQGHIPITVKLCELETPCLIANRTRVEQNARRMDALARQRRVRLRPHMKTAKSAEIGAIALAGRTPRVTIATADEAWHFLEAGVMDIRWAVALTRNKHAVCKRLLAAGATLSVIVADAQSAQDLVDSFAGSPDRIDVLIEIDCGEHRTGVTPEGPGLLDIAGVLGGAPNVNLCGVLTHGGHSYDAADVAQVKDIAAAERDAVIESAQRIEASGIACPERSIGSTPTVVHGSDLEGITEIRPGVYIFGDLFQMQLDACALDDIAVSVLATIISVDRARNRLVIDAGGLALSKDRSTAASRTDYGYGLVVRADGSALPGMPMVQVVHQEHGAVEGAGPLLLDELKVGDQVRVLPNHACMTAAPHDCYYVVAEGSEVVETRWAKTRGW